MAHNSVFRFKFVASYECGDRQSCPTTEKEIDCLSDYYSRHAARTFIPSQHIPRYEVVPVEDDASFRTCKCDANGTRLRNNKSRTRYLLFYLIARYLLISRDCETIIRIKILIKSVSKFPHIVCCTIFIRYFILRHSWLLIEVWDICYKYFLII